MTLFHILDLPHDIRELCQAQPLVTDHGTNSATPTDHPQKPLLPGNKYGQQQQDDGYDRALTKNKKMGQDGADLIKTGIAAPIAAAPRTNRSIAQIADNPPVKFRNH